MQEFHMHLYKAGMHNIYKSTDDKEIETHF